MALSKSSPNVKSKQYLDREIRMVLVGKTGVGKSATGNTIAGDYVFTAGISGNSVTSKCQQHSFDWNGYELQLVDTPGFFDTNMPPEDIREEMGRCVTMSSPGIHAILFVVQAGRFTDEDNNAIEQFIAAFGEECRKYVQVIFTGKDQLHREKKRIDAFVRSCPKPLQMFLSTVQGRYMAVNNNDHSKGKKIFTEELVVRISQMVQANGGMCYTNDMYREAEIQLKKAEDEEVKKIAARDEKLIAKKIALIEAKLREQLLSEQEHARKIKEEEEALMASLEDDHRKEARRHLRSKIGKLFGAVVGCLLGIPSALGGFSVAGPLGTLAGWTAGVAAGSTVGGYIGGKIGENISD